MTITNEDLEVLCVRLYESYVALDKLLQNATDPAERQQILGNMRKLRDQYIDISARQTTAMTEQIIAATQKVRETNDELLDKLIREKKTWLEVSEIATLVIKEAGNLLKII